MALPSGPSSVLSFLLCVLIFSTMQMFKDHLSSGQLQTILGGFLGSWFFIFFLTVINPLLLFVLIDRECPMLRRYYSEKVFKPNYSQKVFMYFLLACIIVSAVVSGLVHRVSATVCIIFSIIALYYINILSHKLYGPAPVKIEEVPKKGRAKGK